MPKNDLQQRQANFLKKIYAGDWFRKSGNYFLLNAEEYNKI